MIRRYIWLLFIVVLLPLAADAQPYCNEWINFSSNQQYSNQQYFRVSVWKDGIYRISYSDLQNAGFPVSSLNPKQLQLFHEGEEQFILVEGEADGVFNQNDYIEFFGRKNDGSLDTRMYADPLHQLNSSYSLITDTASYFLTINSNPLITNRRMVKETDVNFLGYTPLPYNIQKAFRGFADFYNERNYAQVIDPSYSEGEGWTSGTFGNNGATLPVLPVPNASNNPFAPQPVAETIVMGANNNPQASITVEVNGATSTTSYSGFAVNRFTMPISTSSLSSGTATFKYTPGSGGTNLNTVPFIQVTYAHNWSFNGQALAYREFEVPGNLSIGKSMITMTNVNAASPRLYMFSGDTLKQVSMVSNSGALQALVPTIGQDRDCFITDTVYSTATGNDLYITPVSTDPTRYARFINYNFDPNGDFLIVSHPKIWSEAQQYSAYRATSGYQPLLVDVNELYDQFAYGVQQHPLAIRNFCDFAIDTFIVKPKHLFLLGKSVVTHFNRKAAANWELNLVPTYGYPPSDLLYVSALNDTVFRPDISVGRLSAQNGTDVLNYLDKVMVHEMQLQLPPQSWMKKVLHFGGGNTIQQQDQIKQILQGYENQIEDTLYGGDVITFLKTSSDPIQVNLSEYLQATIDSGVSMMTFVAHASGTSFDISTDLPQNYNNEDRYPVIIANSCFVGNIHTPQRLISEDFLLLPKKGAIGFIAEPSVGYLNELSVYTGHLYRQIGIHNYGGTLGESMKYTIDSMITDPVVNGNPYAYFLYKSTCMGMTLQGDPALVIANFDKPDYEITNASISFSPELITSDIDSFDVHVHVRNLGRAENHTFVLHLQRNFPDGGAFFEMDTLINYIPYKDTVTIRLPVDQARGVGLNLFDVYVDYFNEVDEYSENNNTALGVQMLIRSTDIIPVFPYEFSIVPGNDITLKATTANLLAPVKPYVFQVDTTDRFNSPFAQQTIISSAGGVLSWDLPFQLQEDLVYYWRVSRDSLPGDTIHPTWKESSFIHKNNITGWSQAHHSQFKNDIFTNIDFSNTVDSTFQFVTNASTLFMRNFLNLTFFDTPTYEINSVVQDYQTCGTLPSVHVAVIDSITLEPWTTEDHYFGNVNTYDPATNSGTCRARPEKYFIFRMTGPANNQQALEDMLRDSIPCGNYVLLYTVYGGQYSQWQPSLMQEFLNLGADSVQYLQDYQPYIYFTKKCNTGYNQEVIGDSSRTYITMSATLGGNWSKGFVTSREIGPGVQWNELHWAHDPLEPTPGADSIAIDIIGIQPSGVEVSLPNYSGITPATPDLNISSIDANQYPKLKLRAYKQDEQLYTPPQLKRWQIYYEDVPELALNPVLYYKINRDTLEEGDDLFVEMAVENIGNKPMDSVLVDFYYYDAQRVKHQLPMVRYKPLNPGDTLICSTSINTNGIAGINSLWIEANPDDDQPEQYHFNNLAEINFVVNRDITNPILDVTFDGVHILDGDLVSGKPNIQIRLKDENEFLALNDTSDWQVFLTDPDGVQRKLAFELSECGGLGDAAMKWCPAQLPDNTFKIEYNPVLNKDGVYELWVQATDRSSNLSGDNQYRITFEVINKSTITHVVNYPNPFSTSTRFVFTLTGSKTPDYFKIQIMTITGKIVREITRDEIGPIRIGKNITDYAWDGKDEFGDQLANGVYLYRVITRIGGEEIENRETEADQYFRKGWGKMYLMR
jgi:hypothetical protein